MTTLVLIAGGLVTALAFPNMDACKAGHDLLNGEAEYQKALETPWTALTDEQARQAIWDQMPVIERRLKTSQVVGECLDAEVVKQ